MALSVVTLYPYQSTIIISYISQKVFSFVTWYNYRLKIPVNRVTLFNPLKPKLV
jgi:hypothetical protein